MQQQTTRSQWPGRDDLARRTDTFRLRTSYDFQDAVTCQPTRCSHPRELQSTSTTMCTPNNATTVNMTALSLVITRNQPYRNFRSRNVVVVLALPLTAFWQWQWGNLTNCRAAGPSVLKHGMLMCPFFEKLLLNLFSYNKRYYKVLSFRKFLFILVSGWEHSNTEPSNQNTNDQQIT
jgi:hypothetical protein